MPSVSEIDTESLSGTRNIEELKQLTDLDEITECLRQLDEEEAQVDADLDRLLSERASMESKLENLSKMKPRIEVLQSGASDLATVIGETSEVAERISAQVRQLDVEQSRVKQAMQQVEDIQELKTCILGLHSAMNSKDWEGAAQYLHRARRIDPSVVNGKFAEAVVPTSEIPDPPPKTLEQAQDTLHGIFMREFESATHRRSEADITRYFKLFPLIGKEVEGLDTYARFICGIVAGRCHAFMMQKSSNLTFYASALTALFENIAMIVDQHQPVVDSHYGQGKFFRVIERLQDECDKQGGIILNSWWDERNIQRKISEINTYTFPHLNALKSDSGLAKNRSPTLNRKGHQTESSMSSLQDDDGIDPREIDIAVNELALMSARWNLYLKFLKDRCEHQVDATKEVTQNGDSAKVDSQEPHANSILSDLLKKSSLKVQLDERMTNVYDVMESWFLRRSIEKAHLIDEADLTASPPTTSCVDDTFYILKKTIYRVISTSSILTLNHMTFNMSQLLEADYGNVLVKRLENVYQVYPTVPGGRGNNSEAEKRRRDKEQSLSYMTLLNDLDISSEYIHRLVDEIMHSRQLESNFFIGEDLEQAQEAVKGLSTLSSQFGRSLSSGLDQLFSQLIKPRIRPFLNECYGIGSANVSTSVVPKDTAGSVQYNINEDEYQEAELQDAVRRRFSKGWEVLVVEPYKDSMTTTLFGQLIVLSVDALVRPWEKMILNWRFTELGALRLDKDIRAVQLYLSSLTTFGVRDRFARLNQIATVLNLEGTDDVEDLWNNSGISWRLTLNEVKKIAALRQEQF